MAGSGDGISLALMCDRDFSQHLPPRVWLASKTFSCDSFFIFTLSAWSAGYDLCDPSPLPSASFGPRVLHKSASHGGRKENHKGFVSQASRSCLVSVYCETTWSLPSCSRETRTHIRTLSSSSPLSPSCSNRTITCSKS